MRNLFVAFMAVAGLSGHAFDAGDVLFFAPFEDTADAAMAEGEAGARSTGTVSYETGVRGRAAVLDAASLLTYAFDGNVVPDEGTIMMWVKPQWPFSDEKFHHFFRASTGNFRGKALNAIMLYKYGRWSRLLFYTSNGQKTKPQEGRAMAFRNELEPEPGTWLHLAATWSCSVESTEMLLYLNGERIAACAGAVFLPEEMPANFEVGGPKGSGTTWFDDLLILRRPLLGREIAEVYRNTASTKAQPSELPFTSEDSLQMQAYPLFGSNELAVLVDYRGARRELAGKTGKLELGIARGDKIVTAAAAAGSAGLTRVRVAYDRIGPGQVRVGASLKDERGRLLRTGAIDYDVPAVPAWVGNRLGVTDRVLPPWTPLRARDRAVEMWGRRYIFDGAHMPVQFLTQESPLLRGPLRLAGRVNGAVAEFATQRVRGGAAGDALHTVEWSGQFGALRCEGKRRIEFDGFMLYELEFSSPTLTNIEALELTVPFRAESATLYHHANGTWSKLSDAGAVGGTEWRRTLAFVPYVWIGTEAGGLAWFCESDWNWNNTDPARAVEIVRTTDGTDLRVHFVDKVRKLTEPLRLTFGFMATPVKPMPSGWRDWRPMFTSALHLDRFAESKWRQRGCRNISVLWNNHVGAFSSLPADPEALRGKVALLHGKGWQTVVSYYALNQTQTGTKAFDLAEREWRRDPYGEQTFSQGSYATVCTASIWVDHLLWVIDKTMDETGTDGVYLDCSNPRFCKSREHGCAPGHYPLFATRELQKRIYALVRSKRGDAGFVYSHNSESNFMTTYSFADAVVNGEQYNRKDLGGLTFAKFRAEMSPQPYGVPAFLLPTLTKFQAAGKEKMPGAEFLCFPLLHDVICLPQWVTRESQDLLLRAQGVLHDFAAAKAEFLPYWRPAEETGIDAAGAVLVSGYARPDGQGLLLVAQGPEQAATVPVSLDGKLAQLRGAAARDPLTGQVLRWHDGRLQWPLRARDAQFALVTRRQ